MMTIPNEFAFDPCPICGGTPVVSFRYYGCRKSFYVRCPHGGELGHPSGIEFEMFVDDESKSVAHVFDRLKYWWNDAMMPTWKESLKEKASAYRVLRDAMRTGKPVSCEDMAAIVNCLPFLMEPCPMCGAGIVARCGSDMKSLMFQCPNCKYGCGMMLAKGGGFHPKRVKDVWEEVSREESKKMEQKEHKEDGEGGGI